MKPPQVKIGNVRLKNPVICASGTFGYGEEFKSFFDINKLGGFVTKTITLKARKGNPSPRIYDLGFGILNSIGLENPGLEGFKEKLKFLGNLDTCLFVSIYADNLKEWLEIVSSLDKERISGFELNFSCPNIKEEIISYNERKVFKIVSSLRKITERALIVKLSFSFKILKVSLASQEAGADALVLINTLPAMAYSLEEKRPVLGNVYGGLSGPCLKPVALRCVYEVSRKTKIPVIGSGGIMNFRDALEYFHCGAKAVQIGSANLVDPYASLKIIKDLKRYYEKEM